MRVMTVISFRPKPEHVIMMPVDPPAFCLMSFSLPVLRVRVLDDLGTYTTQFGIQIVPPG
jgi:hypothetical protein